MYSCCPSVPGVIVTVLPAVPPAGTVRLAADVTVPSGTAPPATSRRLLVSDRVTGWSDRFVYSTRWSTGAG